MQDERINMRFWVRGYAECPAATVVVAVFRQAGSNAVDVSQVRPRSASQHSARSFPARSASCRFTTARRPSSTASRTCRRRSVIAFVLVVLVIFIFLGRATDTLIPAVALPLSLLLTFMAMQLLGYSLDNLSLMALTLAIGFLVDDAIVFLENTVRLMEEGHERPRSDRWSRAKEISFTILSMTHFAGGGVSCRWCS